MVASTTPQSVVRDIKRRTRRKFSSEEKIRIVLEGLEGKRSIAEICRREGIHQNLYDKWSKDILESGKKRLTGDTMREAMRSDVAELKKENAQLKHALAEMFLKNRLLKKNLSGMGVDTDDLRDIPLRKNARSSVLWRVPNVR